MYVSVFGLMFLLDLLIVFRGGYEREGNIMWVGSSFV